MVPTPTMHVEIENAVPPYTGGLPYRIADHKKNWTIWFLFFCFDGCVLPVGLFYILWFGTSLSHWSGTPPHPPTFKVSAATQGRETDCDLLDI
jgi:hypothetical protein